VHRQRNEPLKGESQERHLPETWQGGGGRKKVAERLRKPASDTVADGLGPVGGFPAKAGETDRATGRTWTSFAASAEGTGNPRRGARDREVPGGDDGKYRVGGPNPRRG